MKRERWQPRRSVPRPQICAFCQGRITAGFDPRGTRAWYSLDRDVWEHLECRSEGFRAESASEDRRLTMPTSPE